ncbi:hypothetical protein GCM10023170_085060 [Phytohabitans houttuyneae]|uniref:Uncharacterized protein n=1 Tax=Phytohabitans houttuyneae TaxID=1076126 RepID=A0A6V8KI85_9ACTN|nr:hypothetical protein Phou_077340 [Phytohabitans houttuyneae]
MVLRLAARRWPVPGRAERLAEWTAEVHVLRHERGGAVRRELRALRFAASLALSAPPRGGAVSVRPWLSPGTAGAAVALGSGGLFVAMFAVLATGPVPVALLRDLSGAVAGPELEGWLTAGMYAGWLLTLVALCGLGGTALGRALPGVPVLAVALALGAAAAACGTYQVGGTGTGAMLDPLLIGLAVWLASCVVLTAQVRRRIIGGQLVAAVVAGCVGTLILVEAAGIAAAAPLVAPTLDGAATALRWAPAALAGASGSSLPLMEDAPWLPGQLLLLTAITVGYTLGSATRERQVAAPPPPDLRTPLPGWWRPGLGGLVALVAALAAWAYAVAVLTPAVPEVAAMAPMPGGDGELYMWVAELRWAAIATAAIGLLAATADRHRPPLAAAGLGTLLLVADGVLARDGVTDPRVPALVAAAVAGAAWWLAGPRLHVPRSAPVRRRLTVAAVTSIGCGPFLLVQGTPEVNHRLLPAGFAVVTAGLAVLAVMLAAFATWHGRATPPRPLAVGALVVLVAVPLGALGAGTTNGAAPATTAMGILLAGPATLAVLAILRGHRPRARTIPLWTLAGIGAAVPAVMAVVTISVVGAPLLFALSDTTYPVDGLAAIPGAALLWAAAGILYALWLAPVTRPARRLAGNPRPVRSLDAELVGGGVDGAGGGGGPELEAGAGR